MAELAAQPILLRTVDDVAYSLGPTLEDERAELEQKLTRVKPYLDGPK